jgi:phage shock protein PspC (stress-responsive transcriptional regulator)
MKKTIKINIGGIVFQLDEDAYDKLKIYLDLIGRRFGSSAEGKEIVDDIERRIAELLLDRTSNQKDAVTLPDVEEVIAIMGSPEDFSIPSDGNEPEAEHHAREEAEDHLHTRRKNRRLYRDTDNSVLGGVCSGLGAYFSLDPVILRVLFVVFAFAWGITIILYLILWIIVPPARTAAQRLEMSGENVTIENIERSVREEYDSIKKNVRKYGRSETYQGARTAIGEMFHILGVILKAVARVILIIFGLFFILMGFGLMLTFLTGLILTQPFLNNIFIDSNVSLSELSSLILTHSDYQWIMIATVFAVCIPLLAIMYAGIKMVVRFKAKDTAVLLSFLGVWIISAFLLTSLIVIKVKDYSGHAELNTSTNLNEFKNQTIVLDILPGKIDSLKRTMKYFEHNGGVGVYFNHSRNEYYSKPFFSIQKADSLHSGLFIEKWAMGKNRQAAREYASNINYSWNQNDTAIIFSPVYELPKGKAWGIPHMNVNLYIPENTKVIFTKRMLDFLHYSDSNVEIANWDEWYNDGFRSGQDQHKAYIMNSHGLKAVK